MAAHGLQFHAVAGCGCSLAFNTSQHEVKPGNATNSQHVQADFATLESAIPDCLTIGVIKSGKCQSSIRTPGHAMQGRWDPRNEHFYVRKDGLAGSAPKRETS